MPALASLDEYLSGAGRDQRPRGIWPADAAAAARQPGPSLVPGSRRDDARLGHRAGHRRVAGSYPPHPERSRAGAHDSRCNLWCPRRPTRMGGGETHRTADPRGDAARGDGVRRRRRAVALHRWIGPGRLVLRRLRPVPLEMAQGHGGRPRAAPPVRRAPERSPLHLQCDARVVLPADRCGRRHAGGRRRLRRVDTLRLRGVVRGVGRRSGDAPGLARAVHRDRRHISVGLRRGADPQLRQPAGVVVSALRDERPRHGRTAGHVSGGLARRGAGSDPLHLPGNEPVRRHGPRAGSSVPGDAGPPVDGVGQDLPAGWRARRAPADSRTRRSRAVLLAPAAVGDRGRGHPLGRGHFSVSARLREVADRLLGPSDWTRRVAPDSAGIRGPLCHRRFALDPLRRGHRGICCAGAGGTSSCSVWVSRPAPC